MINNKTIVVVGAGASNDLGLPIGSGLQKEIFKLLDTSSGTFRYLRSAAHHYFEQEGLSREQIDAIVERAGSMSNQMRSAASIDNFLDQHKDEVHLVAFFKILILYALAEKEQNSRLAGRLPVDDLMTQCEDYFLYDFLNIVVRNHQGNNIHESLGNLTFVIFNYDRCVEYFLDVWLRFRFKISISDLQTKPEFIHVYGSIGEIEGGYTPNTFGRRNLDLPFQNPHLEIPALVKNIKIFTEQEDSSVANQIDRAMKDATALVFLGFGFEEQNMRFFKRFQGRKNVFATAYGMSYENQEFIRDFLKRFASRNGLEKVYLSDDKAKQFIEKFYHPLTRAVGSI